MSAGSRRRAPMLWAPTMHGEDEDTRLEDHPPWDAVVDEPALNPSQASIALPPPRRMPKATPPPPIADATPPTPMPMPMPMFYATAPLPFAELATASVPRQIPRWSRIVMPIGGVLAVIAFTAAFFATRDHRPELPPIASVSRAEPIVAAAAAPAPAVIPADSHWKPRAVVPTLAAEAPVMIDTAAIDAAVDAATAIDDVDPVVIAKPVAAKTIVRPKKRVAHKTAKKVHRITRSSAKRRRLTVDASSALGGMRPGKAW